MQPPENPPLSGDSPFFDLVGHAMGCLEPSQTGEMDALLRADSRLSRQSKTLMEALSLLREDPLAPPANLAQRTIARVERAREADSATIIRLPKAPQPSRPSWSWSSWRLGDLLAAGGVMMVAGLIGFPAIHQAWVRQRELACQDTLRTFGTALNHYADANQGRYPHVASAGPNSVASTYMVSLRENGFLPEGGHSFCADLIPQAPPDRAQMDRFYQQDPTLFHRAARAMGGSYAYPLGWYEDGKLTGPHRNQDNDHPILADKGPRTTASQTRPPHSQMNHASANSPNHGGRGQNVLYKTGNVRFMATRQQPDGCDIYLNNSGEMRAGISPGDLVLAPGDAHP